MLDTPFGGNTVKGLHTVPGSPLLAGLVLVALTASRDTVAGLVFAATGLGADVVDSKTSVVNRRLTTVSATVVPRVFDTLAPLAASFTAG